MTVEQIAHQIDVLVNRMVEDRLSYDNSYEEAYSYMKTQIAVMLARAKTNKETTLRDGLSLTAIELEGYQRALQEVLDLFEEK
jgi:hypothetical protein